MHEELVVSRASVYSEFTELNPGLFGHRPKKVRHLVGYGFKAGPYNLGLTGREGHAADDGPRRGAPVRGSEASEGRDEIDSAVVRNGGRKCLCLRRAAYEFEVVGHPLQGGSGRMDVAFEGIPDLAESREAHRGHETLGSRHGFEADVDHHRRAGAIGGLAETLGKAHLAYEGSVGVSYHAGDFDRLPEEAFSSSLPETSIRRAGFRHHGPWNGEELQKVVVPVQGVDVEKKGAGGVGVVGRMDLPSGEFPDKP